MYLTRNFTWGVSGDWILPQDTFCFTRRHFPTVFLAFPRNPCPQNFRFCSGHGLAICMKMPFPCCCPNMQERTGESLWKHCSATQPSAALSALGCCCCCSVLGWPTQYRQCLWSYRGALTQERLCSHWDYDRMGAQTVVLIICVSVKNIPNVSACDFWADRVTGSFLAHSVMPLASYSHCCFSGTGFLLMEVVHLTILDINKPYCLSELGVRNACQQKLVHLYL